MYGVLLQTDAYLQDVFTFRRPREHRNFLHRDWSEAARSICDHVHLTDVDASCATFVNARAALVRDRA